MTDAVQLMIIKTFLQIHTDEGPDAAIAWAEARLLKIQESESSDTEPHLKIVD